MRGAVVQVSGFAGAGKSTLCRALVDLEPGWLHIEADRCLPHAHASLFTNERVRADLVRAFHESVAAYTARGFVAVVDGSLPAGPDTLRHDCLESLASASGGDLVRVELQIDRPTWDERNPGASAEAVEWFERQSSMSDNRSERFDLAVDARAYEPADVRTKLKELLLIG